MRQGLHAQEVGDGLTGSGDGRPCFVLLHLLLDGDVLLKLAIAATIFLESPKERTLYDKRLEEHIQKKRIMLSILFRSFE